MFFKFKNKKYKDKLALHVKITIMNFIFNLLKSL